MPRLAALALSPATSPVVPECSPASFLRLLYPRLLRFRVALRELRNWYFFPPEEVAEAEVPAEADREHWTKCLAHDAACLPFGMVGEPRRKLGPITTLVLLLSMGVDLMDIRVSAVFPSSRQRAAF